MKTWRWRMAIVSGVALIMACTTAVRDEGNDDSNNSSTTDGVGEVGGHSAGGTGGVGTTTTATTTGGQCNSGIGWADPTCSGCMDGQCCEEGMACGTDTSATGCVAYLSCVQSCSNNACFDLCETVYAPGKALWDAVEGCLTLSCPTECSQIYEICSSPVSVPGGISATACARCLGEGPDLLEGTTVGDDDCCLEVTNCYNDDTCRICSFEGWTSNCIGNADYETLHNCWNTNCMAVCGALE